MEHCGRQNDSEGKDLMDIFSFIFIHLFLRRVENKSQQEQKQASLPRKDTNPQATI